MPLAHGFNRMILCLAAALFCAALCLPAHAWAGETQTLAGSMQGEVILPSSVSTVVLSGVEGSDDSAILCQGDLVLEIADGTENHLGGIMVYGTLEVRGSGNLSITSILGAGAYITLNHTGTIDFGQGMLCNMSGDIIVNSGIITTQPSEAMEYAILASSGTITINGGYLDLNGYTSAMYGYKAINLNGGTIKATAQATNPIIAGLNDDSPAITVSDTMDMGDLKVAYYQSSDGEASISVITNAANETITNTTLSGPSVTDATDYSALVTTNTEETSTAEGASQSNEASSPSSNSLSGKTLLIAGIATLVVITAIAAIVITRKRITTKK